MSKKVVRIGIVGSAGVGKSSLGVLLAAKLDVPFLESKKVTLDILKKEDYDYSSGIQVERFLAQGNRQDKILKRTAEEQNKVKYFVTDRTAIDLAAYAIAELHNSDTSKIGKIINQCKELSNRYTHLIVCPWGIKPLVDNKLRTLNPWYQFTIHSICMNILKEWKLSYLVLRNLDERQRVKEVMKYLKK